jgi:hypothetical protein
VNEKNSDRWPEKPNRDSPEKLVSMSGPFELIVAAKLTVAPQEQVHVPVLGNADDCAEVLAVKGAGASTHALRELPRRNDRTFISVSAVATCNQGQWAPAIWPARYFVSISRHLPSDCTLLNSLESAATCHATPKLR